MMISKTVLCNAAGLSIKIQDFLITSMIFFGTWLANFPKIQKANLLPICDPMYHILLIN